MLRLKVQIFLVNITFLDYLQRLPEYVTLNSFLNDFLMIWKVEIDISSDTFGKK